MKRYFHSNNYFEFNNKNMSSDENPLSSQIKGLKRAAAANRAKSTLAGGPVPNQAPTNHKASSTTREGKFLNQT